MMNILLAWRRVLQTLSSDVVDNAFYALLLMIWNFLPWPLSLPFLHLQRGPLHPQIVTIMEAPNDCDMESVDVVNNDAKDEKPSEATAVPESRSKPKLPGEMEKWSREWHMVSPTPP